MKILYYLDSFLSAVLVTWFCLTQPLIMETAGLPLVSMFTFVILYHLIKLDSVINKKYNKYKPLDKRYWGVYYNVVIVPVWKMIIDNHKMSSAYKCNFYGMTTKYGLTVDDIPLKLYTYTFTGNVIWWIYLLLRQSYRVTDFFKLIAAKIKRYMKSELDSVKEYKQFEKEYVNKYDKDIDDEQNEDEE